MTDGPTDGYVFNRDYLDNNRINLQHWVWREIFGYLIHPKIPTNNPQLRIADVGTGTGIWLNELADRLPSTVRLDGLDISLDAVTPSPWLPSNVRCFEWDIKADVPEDFQGVYDIVHVRNFAFVLRGDEVPSALARLALLLKPGGFLQWGEADITSIRLQTTSPTVATDAMSRLMELSKSQDTHFSSTWTNSLAPLVVQAGFRNVQVDVREANPWIAHAMHECSLLIYETVASRVKDPHLKQTLFGLLADAAKASREGAMWTFTRSTVVGMKA